MHAPTVGSALPWILLTLAAAIMGLALLTAPSAAGEVRPGEFGLAVAAQATATPTWPPATALTGQQVRVAYGVTQLPVNGAGKLIGILDGCAPSGLQADLNAFSQANALPTVVLTVVPAPGVTPVPCPAGVNEASLDVQAAHAMAPGAQIVMVIFGSPTTATAVDNAIQFISTLRPHVVSMSFHYPQPQVNGTPTVAPFQPGIVWVGASGDDGYDFKPAKSFMQNPYPRVDPRVVSVGGSTVYINPDGSYAGERAWSCPPRDGCSGGGFGSPTPFPLPTYQVGFVPTYVPTPAGRMVPDVTALADNDAGLRIFVNGGTTPIAVGGTSLATPLWAGILALAVPTGTSSEQVLGALYTLARTPTAYAANFNDIQIGHNGPCANPPAPPQVCQAGPGYDLVTGLGSPRANSLVPTLAALLSAPSPSATASPTPTGTPTTTPTATHLPATQTVIALTPTATHLPATQTVIALTPTATHLPATQTAIALTATATATRPPPTAPVVPPGVNPPPASGQPGVPAASQPGQEAAIGGAVSGTCRVVASMQCALVATGPSTVAVGGLPAAFLPTTAGVESFACAPLSAARQTTCAGNTVGNVLQGATITVRLPLLGGGALDVTGVATGPGPSLAAPVVAPLPLLPPPPLPLAPPLPPVGPPPPLGGPPPVGAPPVGGGAVPLIPEGDTLALLVVGLALAAVWRTWRVWRR